MKNEIRAVTVFQCVLVATSVACSAHATGLVLVDQAEARRLGAELQVQFTIAADAANRAVMADTDAVSAAAAHDAMAARGRVDGDLKALDEILRRLKYSADRDALKQFTLQYEAYEKVDDETLRLAVENTNLKAQRLSFTSAQAAVDSFRRSLDSLARTARPRDRLSVKALCAEATTAVLAIQVGEARHIAESEGAAMTHLEDQMAESDAAARQALTDLRPLVLPIGASALADATVALNQLKTVNDEVVRLSRRNSNVRSLALALGVKHAIRAKCEAALEGLNNNLAQHDFKATR